MMNLPFKKIMLPIIAANLCFLVSAQPANLPKPQSAKFRNDTFNIIKYGAKADGQFINTESINAAIDDCSKKGGGVVLVPKGIWITGPIVLKSNVNLHLERNALVQFSSDLNQYKLVS